MNRCVCVCVRVHERRSVGWFPECCAVGDDAVGALVPVADMFNSNERHDDMQVSLSLCVCICVNETRFHIFSFRRACLCAENVCVCSEHGCVACLSLRTSVAILTLFGSSRSDGHTLQLLCRTADRQGRAGTQTRTHKTQHSENLANSGY
jgi:hypothetical protein